MQENDKPPGRITHFASTVEKWANPSCEDAFSNSAKHDAKLATNASRAPMITETMTCDTNNNVDKM